MATGARDLTFNILSKQDRFDLTRPAQDLDTLADSARDAGRQLEDTGTSSDRASRDLERVGDTARDAGAQLERAGDDARTAGRELERVGDAARDSGRDLDRAGDDARTAGERLEDTGDAAKEAARRYDAAADAIAAASRRSARAVDDASDRAGESLKDMGDEGTDTAREMAASFDGTSDGIQDAMQEAATNVLATLGPLGAVVGVAGGVAIGWLRGQAERLREEVSGLVSELLDAGRGGRGQLITDQLRKLAEEGRILDLANQARTAKVDVKDYLRAVAGDPDAIERTRDALWKYNTEIGLGTQAYTAGGYAAAAMREELNTSGEVWKLAADAAAAYNDALPPGVAAQEAFTDAVGEFSDVAGTYADVLADKEEKERETAQATADATASQTDSWEDYAKSVDVSVDEYLDALERQVTAQEEWADNLTTLAKRGVSEGVLAELARMGPEGAPLVAKLTTASDSELRRLVEIYTRKGSDAGDELADGITTAYTLAKDEVTGQTIRIPTAVGSPTNTRAVLRDVQNDMQPVIVPVMLQQVPQSIWSRYVP